jgi:branched-chain amino acid transport system ATP-binding protein
MTHLSLDNVSVNFGAIAALKNVTISMNGPAKIGLIGPNGAGKTTLLSTIAGFVSASEGSVQLDSIDITRLSIQKRVAMGIVRSFQTARLLNDETVRTNVLLGCQPLDGPGSVRQMFATPGYRKWNKLAQERSREIEEIVGISDIQDVQVAKLPSAMRRFVEIARVLVAQPKVLLLDEPAAGLDHGERRQLERILHRISEQRPTLMVLVEHDVAVVRNVCDYTYVLAEGTLLAEGATNEVLADQSVLNSYFGGAARA